MCIPACWFYRDKSRATFFVCSYVATERGFVRKLSLMHLTLILFSRNFLYLDMGSSPQSSSVLLINHFASEFEKNSSESHSNKLFCYTRNVFAVQHKSSLKRPGSRLWSFISCCRAQKTTKATTISFLQCTRCVKPVQFTLWSSFFSVWVYHFFQSFSSRSKVVKLARFKVQVLCSVQ